MLPSRRKSVYSPLSQIAMWWARMQPERSFVVGCGALVIQVGCGGAAENDNVLARAKAFGGSHSGARNNSNAGNHFGGSNAAGSRNAAGGGNGGTTIGTAGRWGAGAMAGASGSDPCSGQCIEGRSCRKVVNQYQCVTATCGPELTATLDFPDRDGGLVALGRGYAFVVTKTALEVVDIHNPRAPQRVGALAGAFVGIAWEGDRLYLADAVHGLAVVDIRVPEQPKLVTTLAVDGGVTCVRADGAVAYLCAGDAKQKAGYLQVVDLSVSDEPILRGQLSVPPAVRSIDSAGPLVYLVDNGGLFVVVDVTDLDQPMALANLSVPGANCVKLSGSRAFVGAGDLVVIDVTTPARPMRIADLYTEFSIRSLAVEGNLVATMSSYGYNSGSHVQVLDVSDLAQPVISPLLTGSANEHWTGPTIAVEQGFAYVAGAGNLAVQDVSTPVNQRIVDSIPIQAGLIHGMELQYSRAYVIGMGYGPGGALQVINVWDPLHMSVEGSFSVLAKGLAVQGQLGYLLGYTPDTDLGDAFLQIELSSPSNSFMPRKIGELALDQTLTEKCNGQIAISMDGYYAYLLGSEVIAVVSTGMNIYVEKTEAPELVRSIDLPRMTTNRIRVTATHAFVTTTVHSADGSPDSGALLVFDLNNPADPLEVGTVATTAGLTGLEVAGSYAYAGAIGQGLVVIDISNPSAPRVVGTVDTPDGGEDELALLNNLVYLGKAVVDVSTPKHPIFRNSIEIPGAFRRVSSTGKMFTAVSGSSGKYGGWPGALNYIDPTRCAP